MYVCSTVVRTAYVLSCSAAPRPKVFHVSYGAAWQELSVQRLLQPLQRVYLHALNISTPFVLTPQRPASSALAAACLL